MSRYSGRTYSRTNNRETAANKAFDDIINDNNKSRPSASIKKWGVTSFTSVRENRDVDVVEDVDIKKRKIDSDDAFSDPFSFDDDEPVVTKSSSNNKGKRATVNANKVTVTKKVSLVKQNTAPTVVTRNRGSPVKTITKISDGLSDKISTSNTYQRKTVSKGTETVPSLMRSSTAPPTIKSAASAAVSKVAKYASQKAVDAKQRSIDLYTKKLHSNSRSPVKRPAGRDENNGAGSVSDDSDECIPIWKRGINSKEDVSKVSTTKTYNKGKEPEKLISSDELWDSIMGLGSKKESESQTSSSSAWSIAPSSQSMIGRSPDHNYFRSPKRDPETETESEIRYEDSNSNSDIEDFTKFKPTKRTDSYDSAYNSAVSRDLFSSSQSSGTDTTNRSDSTKTTRLKNENRNKTVGRSYNDQGSQGSTTDWFRNVKSAATNSDSDSDREGGKRNKSKTSISHLLPLTAKERAAKAQEKETEITADKPTVKPQKSIFTSKQRRFMSSPNKSPAKRYNVRQWQSISPPEKMESESSTQSSSQVSTISSSTSSPVSSSCSSKLSRLALDFPEDAPPVKKVPMMITRKLRDPPRPGADAVTGLHVAKDAKPLYTVVRNVKEAHECQEHGETQEFFDDIEYLLAGLDQKHSFTTRCLSTLSFANKCLMPAFRMHLRAHGTVTKIFGALLNANENPSLALSTAAIMYMMSRDRLNMDIDQNTLGLMIRLLSLDIKKTDKMKENVCKDYERMKQKVTDVIEQLKKDGGAKSIELSEISTGNLSMEALLSLTSRRAGDWFKEEMRHLGGLEHIVETVNECTDTLDENSYEITPSTLDNLKKIERCLRVLEHVTYLNTDNQMFLISFNSSSLVNCLCMLLKFCLRLLAFNSVLDEETDSKKPSPIRTVLDCLMAVLKVLLNLTHDNEWGSAKVGTLDGILAIALRCTQTVSESLPHDEQFDLLVLSLGLLINLTEHNEVNRRMLVNTSVAKNPSLLTTSATENSEEDEDNEPEKVAALTLLTSLFNQKEQAASQLEESVSKPCGPGQKAITGGESSKFNETADESGEWQESDSGLLWVIGKKKKKGPNGEEDDDSDDENHIEIIPSTQEENENFTKALHKAGKHMEDSIVAAYAALLLGCIVQDNVMLVDKVRAHLPNGSFEPMVKILIKFLGFINLTTAVSPAGTKSIAKVIETLECL